MSTVLQVARDKSVGGDAKRDTRLGKAGKSLARAFGTLLRTLGTLVKWCLIAFTVLAAGGFFARGLSGLWRNHTVVVDGEFLWALLVFAAGGGVAIGVLFVAWQVARADPLAKIIALLVLLLVAGAVVIWPTPYKYYRADDLSYVVRITRLTGEVKWEERSAPELTARR